MDVWASGNFEGLSASEHIALALVELPQENLGDKIAKSSAQAEMSGIL